LVNLAWILDVVESVEIGTILVLSSLIVLFIIVYLLQCYDNINLHLVYSFVESSVVHPLRICYVERGRVGGDGCVLKASLVDALYVWIMT
jgi:hypothetical protein